MIVVMIMLFSVLMAIYTKTEMYRNISDDASTISKCSGILHDNESRRTKYQKILKDLKNDRISRQK